MKQLFILTIAVLSASMFSCSSDDDNTNPEDKGTALTSIKGTSAIDLSDRADWVLKVNGITYNSTISGISFDAKPIDNSKTYHFNNIYPYGTNIRSGQGPSIVLESPNYYLANTRSTSPIKPNISDQTTLAKLNLADRLVSNYVGVVSENIETTFKHADALLMFETVDFPNNEAFTIHSYSLYGYISPYKENNSYKAIVTALHGEFSANIYIKIGDSEQTFRIPLEDKSIVIGNYLRSNSIYKFKLVYDEKTKKISLTDYEVSVWDE